MVKDDQINLNVESKQKERWIEHSNDNPQYRNLTNFIEQAVERQISEDTDDEYSIENDIDFILKELDELKERQETLEELNKEVKQTQSTSLEIEKATERLETFIRTRVLDDDE